MVELSPGQHIHLVGIGGAGLSAIARVLIGQGYSVSGSDRSPNLMTEALARDGATIYEGHAADHVASADVLVISSAVPPDHVEVQAARARGIPIYKRSEMIGALMRGKDCIAVAGTHGKTTTTAMIIHILRKTGRDPSYIVGGTLRDTGQNAGVGQGSAFVIEADEYDNMFHGLNPKTAIITNIEWDHPDFFPTPNDLLKSFLHFIRLVRADGRVIACADDLGSLTLSAAAREEGHSIITYGAENPYADWRAAGVRGGEYQLTFDVLRESDFLGEAALQVPGKHNVVNALAALAAAEAEGVSPREAIDALATFPGTGRRFELRGEVGGVAVVDDYAHHPTAIRATLEAARSRYPGRAVWAVWQPHTYSRTQALLHDYLEAFADADHVLVTDIYAAREQPVPGVGGHALAAGIGRAATSTPSLDDAIHFLDQHVQAPAVIVIMSAGDAPRIGAEFLARRQKAGDEPARTTR